MYTRTIDLSEEEPAAKNSIDFQKNELLQRLRITVHTVGEVAHRTNVFVLDYTSSSCVWVHFFAIST
jgi:hypothetical protein